MLGEMVTCAAVSPQQYIFFFIQYVSIQVQCCPPLRQPHYDLGDFNNGDFVRSLSEQIKIEDLVLPATPDFKNGESVIEDLVLPVTPDFVNGESVMS